MIACPGRSWPGRVSPLQALARMSTLASWSGHSVGVSGCSLTTPTSTSLPPHRPYRARRRASGRYAARPIHQQLAARSAPESLLDTIRNLLPALTALHVEEYAIFAAAAA